MDTLSFGEGVVMGFVITLLMVMGYVLLDNVMNNQIEDVPIYEDSHGYEIYLSKSKFNKQPFFYELRIHGMMVTRIPTDYFGEGFEEKGVTVRHLRAMLDHLNKSLPVVMRAYNDDKPLESVSEQ